MQTLPSCYGIIVFLIFLIFWSYYEMWLSSFYLELNTQQTKIIFHMLILFSMKQSRYIKTISQLNIKWNDGEFVMFFQRISLNKNSIANHTTTLLCWMMDSLLCLLHLLNKYHWLKGIWFGFYLCHITIWFTLWSLCTCIVHLLVWNVDHFYILVEIESFINCGRNRVC